MSKPRAVCAACRRNKPCTVDNTTPLCEGCLGLEGHNIKKHTRVICPHGGPSCGGIVVGFQDSYVLVQTDDGREAVIPRVELIRVR